MALPLESRPMLSRWVVLHRLWDLAERGRRYGQAWFWLLLQPLRPALRLWYFGHCVRIHKDRYEKGILYVQRPKGER